MLMIGNWPKGFPLRSKVIDYLSPPTGKYAGILTDFQTKVKKKISSMLDTAGFARGFAATSDTGYSMVVGGSWLVIRGSYLVNRILLVEVCWL